MGEHIDLLKSGSYCTGYRYDLYRNMQPIAHYTDSQRQAAIDDAQTLHQSLPNSELRITAVGGKRGDTR